MNIGGNYCPQCGGIKRLWYKIEMLTAEDVRQGKNQPSSVSKEPFPLCFGHPEPAPKHDGKLDEQGNRRVRIMGDDDEEFRGKRNVLIVNDKLDNGIVLRPAQALSLLAWLKQEEANLQKLVEEEKK